MEVMFALSNQGRVYKSMTHGLRWVDESAIFNKMGIDDVLYSVMACSHSTTYLQLQPIHKWCTCLGMMAMESNQRIVATIIQHSSIPNHCMTSNSIPWMTNGY